MASLLDVLRYRRAPDQQEIETLFLEDPIVQNILGEVARGHQGAGYNMRDLKDWAKEGFWEALNGYDPWKGFPSGRRLCFKGSAHSAIIEGLNGGKVPRDWFKANGCDLSEEACVEVRKPNCKWELWDKAVVYLVAVLEAEMEVYEGAFFWTYVRRKARDRIRQEIGWGKKKVEVPLPDFPKGALADPAHLLEEALRDRARECLHHVLRVLPQPRGNHHFHLVLYHLARFKSSREMFQALYPNLGKDAIRRMDATFRQWESRTFCPYRDGHWLWRSLEPGVQAQLRRDWEAFRGSRRVSWQGLVEWARARGQEVLRGRDAEAVAGAMAHGLGRTEACSVCWVEEKLRECGCGFTLETLKDLFLR
jgi:hypothetical protein